MASEQAVPSVHDLGVDLSEKLAIAREVSLIERVRVILATEEQARSEVAYKRVSEDLEKTRQDLKGREYQRSTAHHALQDAITMIIGMHSKSAPSHGGGMNGKCKTCGEIRRLHTQVTISERLPDSRMALAS